MTPAAASSRMGCDAICINATEIGAAVDDFSTAEPGRRPDACGESDSSRTTEARAISVIPSDNRLNV